MTITPELKAILTGLTDGLINLLFQFAGQIVAFLTLQLPLLNKIQDGKWAWTQVLFGLLLGTIAKAIDRKIHEDPTDKRTGLITVL